MFLDLPCDLVPAKRDFPNAKYKDDPCLDVHHLALGGMTLQYVSEFSLLILLSNRTELFFSCTYKSHSV